MSYRFSGTLGTQHLWPLVPESEVDRRVDVALAQERDRARAVVAAHPAPEPSGDVVEQATQVLDDVHGAEPRIKAHALADAGLLADPAVRMLDAIARVTPCTCSAQRQRAEKAETERDNARNRAEAAVDWFESELESVRDRFESELESVRGERNEAEARARRAEDALRWLRDSTKHSAMQRALIDRALSTTGQTSDTTPSDTTDTLTIDPKRLTWDQRIPTAHEFGTWVESLPAGEFTTGLLIIADALWKREKGQPSDAGEGGE